MGKKAHGATPALQVLNRAKIQYQLLEYEHSSSMQHGFALDTVEVLHLDPRTVFKTLLAEADGKPVVGVVPVDSHLNMKSLAKAVGAKRAEMMNPDKAERLTGYIRGGISPLGQRKRFPTVIDSGAEELDRMIVSGGKRSLSVALLPMDLVALTGGTFAPIADPGLAH